MIAFITKFIRKFLIGKKQKFIFTDNKVIDFSSLDKIGLYIHIPFCKNVCPYCPYNKILYNKDKAAQYTKAILQEIDLYYRELGRIEISSIYIGGGTPTLLIEELLVILKQIRKNFVVTGNVCIETIVDDLSDEVIGQLKNYKIDLISIGVQSFNKKCLESIGKKYSITNIKQTIANVLKAKFKSVNIDMMFLLPKQDIRDILYDLNESIKTKVNQITTYPLFTFPYSSVGKYLHIKKVKMPNLLKRRRIYKAIHNFFIKKGYKRVSVWGFKKGNVPRYSSVTRNNYIGLGAGACSRLPHVFYMNTFSIEEYIDTTLANKLPIALSMKLTLPLRKYYWLYWQFYNTHIGKKEIYKVFGGNKKIKFILFIIKLLGFCKEENNIIILTERGAFYIHLLQNYFILNYINKVWTICMKDPWPKNISI